MYAGQMSNMATTLGEIRCQLFAQVICLLAVATLFAWLDIQALKGRRPAS